MLRMRYFYEASLVKVVDCATVDLSFDLGFHINTRVRIHLYGVDTQAPGEGELAKAALGINATDYIYDWFNGHNSVWVRTFTDDIEPHLFHGFVYSSHDLRSCLNDDLIDSGLVLPFLI